MDLRNILLVHKLRLTKARITVFEVLQENHSNFLSSDEIYSRVSKKKSGCDRVSVYRTLKTFLEVGIVSKAEFQSEATRYRILKLSSKKNKKSECSTGHYFRCVVCEVVEKIQSCLFPNYVKQLEKKGYKALTHHLEISGYCSVCAE